MHGCGNDFVILGDAVELAPDRVRALCDRRTGIGADGIIVVAPVGGRRRAVAVHNADGSIAEACGNGYRCVARYLLDRLGGDSCELETPGGVVRARRDPTGIALDLAAPELGAALTLELAGRALPARQVRAGNPNVVVFVDDVGGTDLHALAGVAREAAGPANVEAVAVRTRTELELRVEERGVGETLACGTGSCAAVAAALGDGRLAAGRTIDVSLRGGRLTVRPADGRYILAGPAEYVFEGLLP